MKKWFLAACVIGSLSGCSSTAIPPQPNGQIACLVRGFGSAATSHVSFGEPLLLALGYTVKTYEWFVSPETLEECQVIISHSMGALPTLRTTNPHLIFSIDGFGDWANKCPEASICMDFYNPLEPGFGPLPGSKHVNCLIACDPIDKLGYPIGHIAMSSSRPVWDIIMQNLH